LSVNTSHFEKIGPGRDREGLKRVDNHDVTHLTELANRDGRPLKNIYEFSTPNTVGAIEQFVTAETTLSSEISLLASVKFQRPQ
jgi:hypothetical protein